MSGGGSPMRVLVTGGAGFIGSALARHLVLERGCSVLVVDKLTYAGVPLDALLWLALGFAALPPRQPDAV